ncbi:MAG: septum formation family protein [Acidimicrobiia bacterium]|nr:septum formation family protein [Acidimicrobiia bacterium]
MRFDLAWSGERAEGMALGVGSLVVAMLTLSGCGLLSGGDTQADETSRDETGQIVDAGEVGVNALKLGDCFNDNPVDPGAEVVDVLTVQAVPCSEPHDNEVYYLGALPETSYPGEELVDELVLDQCLTVFEAFAGVSYEESRLDIGRIFPSEANWADEDRGYICLVYDVDLQKLEGSMRGRGY